MKKLFIDDFITKKGFLSTEEYIESYVKQMVPWIDFSNLDYYKSLFENNYLRIGNCIRTSDKGNIDEFYQIIDEKGNLRGVTDIPAHQGMKGIFSPEEILIGERISSNWCVHYQTLGKNFRLNKKENEK
jgi:hypothetical protein